MKISIVGSYPDPRLIKEVNTLSDKGVDIDLILWDRGFPFSKNDAQFNVIRFSYGNNYFDSLYAMVYMPFWWIFTTFWLFKRDQDIIHVANFDNYMFALFVAKIKRKKIIYEIIDFYGETILFPIFPNLVGSIIKSMDRFLKNYADIIIIADKSRLKQIGKTKRQVVVINNSPKDVVKEKLKEKEKNFTVFYGGQVSNQRGIDQIILAVKDIPNVNLIVMGYCSSAEYKNKLIKISNNIKNVKLHLESVPHKEILDQTLKSDLLIAMYDPKVPNNKYASPNKLFEAMMCGKPLIVNNETSMINIINEEKCGIAVAYGDIKAIRSAIITLMSNRKLYAEFGKNGRKAYETKYGWDIMEKKLFEIYDL